MDCLMQVCEPEENELINSRGVKFNDRIIFIEETSEGVKIQATGRGFNADFDVERNKWICYNPIPGGFKSAYKKKFSEDFDSEYKVHIDQVIPNTVIFTFAGTGGYLRDGKIHWECNYSHASTFPQEFVEAIKNSFDIDIQGLPMTPAKRRRVSSESLGS